MKLGFRSGGTDAYVQKAGQRLSESPRHYFVSRFDGKKPDYYLEHDELGGMTLALGSWYGNRMHALVSRPRDPAHREALRRQIDGSLEVNPGEAPTAETVMVTWQREITRDLTRGAIRSELKLKDGRSLIAVCGPADDGTFGITLGDAAQPQINARIGASFDVLNFALVVQAGRIKFRAVSALGASPLFQETVLISGLALTDIASVRVSGVDAADLVIE